MLTTTIDYLLEGLRIKIGDTTPDSYRYLDEWLVKTLIIGMKNLQRFWNFKYLIDDENQISRNPDSIKFIIEEPPVIQTSDEYIIILMAAIIILEGSLENSAWDTSSWADAEIRYTNIDGGRIREAHLKRLIDELNSLILPPTKRLARAGKASLPGYVDNPYERYIS